MQECWSAVSDRGIASDAVKKLTVVDLMAHPSRLKSLKSQLRIDRIAFRWPASNIGPHHDGCNLDHVCTTTINFPDRDRNKTLTRRSTAESSKREKGAHWERKSNATAF